jgi:hypothetical protein
MLDHPNDAKILTGYPRNGNIVLLEISHKFFSAWDAGKAQWVVFTCAFACFLTIAEMKEEFLCVFRMLLPVCGHA